MKSRIEMRRIKAYDLKPTLNGNGTLLQDRTNIADVDHRTNEKCRRRSSGGAIFRALSRKHSLTHGKKNCEFNPADPLVIGSRKLIMEGLVQLSKGPLIKDRCIFLYSDLLIVAKQKSHDKYNLKDRVKLSEVWLDVDGVPSFLPNLQCLHHLSFVIGWPSSDNLVAIFTNKNIRDIWYQVLNNHITLMRDKDKASVPVKIALDDQTFSVTKSLMVSNKEATNDLIERCINEFRLQPRIATDYQLHVSSDDDEVARALYGFENPFSIYMNLARNATCSSITNFLPEIKLLLKTKSKAKVVEEKPQTSGKSKMTLFRRILSKSSSQGKLFGRDLSDLITDDNKLCPTLMKMLGEIYVNGPVSTGIFRRSASQGVRNIKLQLDAGDDSILEDIYITDMAALVKEFLRSMPDCLLTSSLYSEWMRVASIPRKDISLAQVKCLLSCLPPSHELLLKHLLCVLNSVTQSSEHNLMTSYNLAVCISQCILWSGENSSPSSTHNLSSISNSPSCSSLEQYTDIARMNLLVQYLIENAAEIFGPECLTLFHYLSERRSSVIASGGNLSQRSTDSDSSQTSITVLKTMSSPTYGFLKASVPKLKQLHSKRGMYASTPSLIPLNDSLSGSGSDTLKMNF